MRAQTLQIHSGRLCIALMVLRGHDRTNKLHFARMQNSSNCIYFAIWLIVPTAIASNHLLPGCTWNTRNKISKMQISARNANNSRTWLWRARSLATRCSRDLVQHQHKHLQFSEYSHIVFVFLLLAIPSRPNHGIDARFRGGILRCQRAQNVLRLRRYVASVAPANFARQKFNRIACDNLFQEQKNRKNTAFHILRLPFCHPCKHSMKWRWNWVIINYSETVWLMSFWLMISSSTYTNPHRSQCKCECEHPLTGREIDLANSTSGGTEFWIYENIEYFVTRFCWCLVSAEAGNRTQINKLIGWSTRKHRAHAIHGRPTKTKTEWTQRRRKGGQNTQPIVLFPSSMEKINLKGKQNATINYIYSRENVYLSNVLCVSASAPPPYALKLIQFDTERTNNQTKYPRSLHETSAHTHEITEHVAFVGPLNLNNTRSTVWLRVLSMQMPGLSSCGFSDFWLRSACRGCEHFWHFNFSQRSFRVDWLSAPPFPESRCIYSHACSVLTLHHRLSCVLGIPLIFNHFSTTGIWWEPNNDVKWKFRSTHSNTKMAKCTMPIEKRTQADAVWVGIAWPVSTAPVRNANLLYSASYSAAVSDETNLMAHEISFGMRYNDKCCICGPAIVNRHIPRQFHIHTLHSLSPHANVVTGNVLEQ